MSTFLKLWPLLLSVCTIYMVQLQGDKKLSAWIVGGFGQVGWLLWIVLAKEWGASCP